jgi:hypothetical protein
VDDVAARLVGGDLLEPPPLALDPVGAVDLRGVQPAPVAGEPGEQRAIGRRQRRTLGGRRGGGRRRRAAAAGGGERERYNEPLGRRA